MQWCQTTTEHYPGVRVANFSRSWADGLALCAILHEYFPTDIGQFEALDGSTAEGRAANFELAFGVAERRLDVERLFDVEVAGPAPRGRGSTTPAFHPLPAPSVCEPWRQSPNHRAPVHLIRRT